MIIPSRTAVAGLAGGLLLLLAGAGLFTSAFAQEPIPGASEKISWHKTSLSAYPYAYYTPETELAVGAGGILTFYTAKDSLLRPSSVSLSAYYTTNKQYKLSATPEIYLTRNRFLIKAPFSYGKYVQKYWGIGNNTPDISNSEFVAKTFEFSLNVQIPPFLLNVTRVGFLWDFQSTPTLDPESNPNITAGTPGAEGGVSSGLGLTWTGDTRNNRFYPTAGYLHNVELVSYFSAIGSDFKYTYVSIDFRSYREWKRNRVLALQAYGNFIADIPPFYELSALGGSSRMRGYYYGRYRDENYVMAQAEHRQYFWRRFGYVLFFGLGEVFGESPMSLDGLRFSAGVGLRYLFDKTEGVNLRMDYGIGLGQDTNGIYFGLGEAF